MDTQTCPSCYNPVTITPEMRGNKWVACPCGTEFAVEVKQVGVRRPYVPPEPDCTPFRVKPLEKLTPVFDIEPKRKHSAIPRFLIGAAVVCVAGVGIAVAYMSSGRGMKTEQIAANVPPASPGQDMAAHASREKGEPAEARPPSDSDLDPEMTLPDVRPDNEPVKKIEKSAKSALDTALADLNGNVDDKRVAAAKRIATMGENAMAASRALCRAMMDPSAKVRQAAGSALAAVNSSLYEPVNTILTDPSPRKAKAAFNTLALMGNRGEASVDVLLAAIELLPKPIVLPGPTRGAPPSEQPGPSQLPPASPMTGPKDLQGPSEQQKPSSLAPPERLAGPTRQRGPSELAAATREKGPSELPGATRQPGPTKGSPPSRLPPPSRMSPPSRRAPPTMFDPQGTAAVLGRGAAQLLHSQPAIWVRTVAGVGMSNPRVVATLTAMMTSPQYSTKVRGLSALALSRASDKVAAASALVSALKGERNLTVALAMIQSIRFIGPIANQTAAKTLDSIRVNGSTDSLKDAAGQALAGIGGLGS